MTDLVIHDLGEDVLRKLRQRADAHGRSVEDEARLELARAVGVGEPRAGVDVQEWLGRLAAFRATMPPMPRDYSSVEAIAEGRAVREQELSGRQAPSSPKK